LFWAVTVVSTGAIIAWLLFAPASPLRADSPRGAPTESRVMDRVSPEGF
jgi:hypothetical protein